MNEINCMVGEGDCQQKAVFSANFDGKGHVKCSDEASGSHHDSVINIGFLF